MPFYDADAYVLEGGNEEGREATPPSISIFDFYGIKHRLRTPNEGIYQRYLKNWADVADKICFGRT